MSRRIQPFVLGLSPRRGVWCHVRNPVVAIESNVGVAAFIVVRRPVAGGENLKDLGVGDVTRGFGASAWGGSGQGAGEVTRWTCAAGA